MTAVQRRHPSFFRYNSVRFRSRLEAQWACFLDGMRVRWTYETKTFRLADDSCYTPDFHLFDFDIIIEVKPDNFALRQAERHKADSLAKTLHKNRVWITHGSPPWFEQLRGDNISAITKALATLDLAPRIARVGQDDIHTAIWVTDERYITRNRHLGEVGNFIPPQAMTLENDTVVTAPAHPLLSPKFKLALAQVKNLKFSDI